MGEGCSSQSTGRSGMGATSARTGMDNAEKKPNIPTQNHRRSFMGTTIPRDEFSLEEQRKSNDASGPEKRIDTRSFPGDGRR